MAIVAASNSTHFLLNGAKHPRIYKVFPHGNLDARLEDTDGSGSIVIESGSTVGGSVQSTQAALVDSLAAVVAPAGGDGSIVAATIGSVQSSLTGATFVALPSVVARWVALQNPNAVDIEYQRGGAGSAYIVRANSDLDVPVLANANELSVRRVDTSNTQVTIRYEVIA